MAEYTYTVDFVSDNWTPTVTGNTTWPTTYWYYPQTIYKYQIFCPKPRCKGKMWAAIDETVTCSKCNSLIKVVEEEPDYTVAIDN